jgi:hypothetical protein
MQAFDDEGYLYVLDRLQDMIVTGGGNADDIRAHTRARNAGYKTALSASSSTTLPAAISFFTSI